MVFRSVPEAANRLIEVETGNSDISMAIAPSDVSRTVETPGVVLHRNRNFSYNYIGFNMKDGPTSDERVRHAIAYALDMDQIVQGAFHGTGAPAQGPLTTQHLHFVPTDPFPVDLDRARELLAEAGYPDGFTTRFWVNDGNQARLDVATIVQNQLRQVGIEVQVEVLEWSVYLARTSDFEHDMYILGWISSVPDPDQGLWNLFHSSNIGSPGNRSYINDPVLDDLLERGQRELDPATRAQIYADAQNLIREIAPHVFMWEGEELHATTERVQNFFASPTGSPWFWDVHFAN
jgi:peptide/nickel transport system substrate-binding protein